MLAPFENVVREETGEEQRDVPDVPPQEVLLVPVEVVHQVQHVDDVDHLLTRRGCRLPQRVGEPELDADAGDVIDHVVVGDAPMVERTVDEDVEEELR